LFLPSTLYDYGLPQIDESSITDQKRFLIDKSQSIAQARTGENASGFSYAQGAAIGAGIGASSGVAFGAMIGGEIVLRAAVGLVIGGLSGGGISVYRTAQPNDQI